MTVQETFASLARMIAAEAAGPGSANQVEVTFRGRLLKGAAMQLPEGYSGMVVQASGEYANNHYHMT